MPKPPPGCETNLLPRVTVRLLRDEERQTFDRLLGNRHYLAGPCPFRAGALESLLERFGRLHDARRCHGLGHRQSFVLACAAVATLMGSSGYQAYEDTCKTFTQRQGTWSADDLLGRLALAGPMNSALTKPRAACGWTGPRRRWPEAGGPPRRLGILSGLGRQQPAAPVAGTPRLPLRSPRCR